MTDTTRAPASANWTSWLIAMLLALTLAASLLATPIALADNSTDTSQSDDDDDSKSGNGKNNPGGKKSSSNKQGQGGKPYCQKSTQYLFLACQHRAIADRWESVAECENVVDKEERADCFVQGKGLVAEAKSGCRAQRMSRNDVCDDVGREAYQGWAEVEFLGGDDEGGSIAGNDYFPLLQSTSTYLTEDTTIEREVSDSFKEVDGVTCKVVAEIERMTEGDVLLERVEHLYAQDIDDTVWTCGVLRQQYGEAEEGEEPMVISTHGSWQAGSNGAQAGIAMRWQPAVGEIERRSYAPGIKEEVAEVIDAAAVASDYICVSECVILRITSPLGPDGYTDEYYESGIGLVHSEDQDNENDMDLQP